MKLDTHELFGCLLGDQNFLNGRNRLMKVAVYFARRSRTQGEARRNLVFYKLGLLATLIIYLHDYTSFFIDPTDPYQIEIMACC